MLPLVQQRREKNDRLKRLPPRALHWDKLAGDAHFAGAQQCLDSQRTRVLEVAAQRASGLFRYEKRENRRAPGMPLALFELEQWIKERIPPTPWDERRLASSCLCDPGVERGQT